MLSNPLIFNPLIKIKLSLKLLFLYSSKISSVISILLSYLVNLKCNLILSEEAFPSGNFFWKYIGNEVINNRTLDKNDKSYIFIEPSYIQVLKNVYIFFIFDCHEFIFSLILYGYFDKSHSLGTIFLLIL